MIRSTALVFLPLPLLLACGDKPDDEGSGEVDDTGSVIEYESGCITVDGGGGYAWLTDALSVAAEGSTITMCAADEHQEAVTIDKSITLVGPGSDALTLVAPTAEHAITITGSSVTISGLAIESTLSGIVVDGAANVSLSDITIAEAGQWGIKATDPLDLSVTEVVLSSNSYGGLAVDGGTATISNSELVGNTGYGVYTTGGAAVNIDANTITDTVPADEDDPSDGHGIYADDGAAVSTTGNTLSNNFFMNLFADGGDAAMSGDVLEGAFYGAVVFNGEASFSDLDITGAYWVGLWASSTDLITAENITTSVISQEAGFLDFDVWGVDSLGGTGIILSSPDVVASNIDISGYNNTGMLVQGDGGGNATLTDITIDDVGLHGMAIETIDADIENLTVTNLKDLDDVDETNDCFYINYINAVYAVQANVDWLGGQVSDGAGWGVVNLDGTMTVEGVDFANHECSSFIGFQSASVLTGNTFSGSADAPVVNSYYESSIVISDNTFADSQATEPVVYEYVYESYTYTITYTDYAQTIDIFAYTTGDAVITGNTFSNGDQGIVIYGSDAEISSNTWEGYRSTPIQIQEYNDGSSVSTPNVTITDVVISDWGSDGIGCYGANVEMEDVSFESGTTYSYSYEYEYLYDTGDNYSGGYTSSNAGAAVFGNGCSMVLDGVEVNGHEGQGFWTYSYTYDGTYELNDVTFSDVGSGDSSYYSAIYSYGYFNESTIYMNDVVVDGAHTGSGIYLNPSNGTYYEGGVTLDATNVQISNTDQAGAYLQSVSANLSGLTVENTGTYGIYANRSTVDITDSSSISDAGTIGLYISDSVANVDGLSVDGSGEYGVWWTMDDDYDGDGYSVAQGDCDDTDANRHPNGDESTEGSSTAGVDNDCDGTANDGSDTTDDDGDGYSEADGDCDDTERNVYPGSPERSWRVDNDCDGIVTLGGEDDLSFTDSTVSDAADGGVYLNGATPVFTGNTISGSSQSLACDDVTFDACYSNTVDGVNECDSSCTEDP